MVATKPLWNDSIWDSEAESLIHANPVFEQNEAYDNDEIPTQLIAHGRNDLIAIES